MGEGGVHCCGGSKGERDNAIFKSINVSVQGYVGDRRDQHRHLLFLFQLAMTVARCSLIPDHPCVGYKAQNIAACRGSSPPPHVFYTSFPWIFLARIRNVTPFQQSGQHCHSRHRNLHSCEVTSIIISFHYNSPSWCSESTLSRSVCITPASRCQNTTSADLDGRKRRPHILPVTYSNMTLLSPSTTILEVRMDLTCSIYR